MDQANKLREMMENINENNKFNLSNSNDNKGDKLGMKKSSKVISVSSGKGGVGKSNFAINLAISLNRKGYEVAILDADIGLGNIEILTGCTITGNISEIISEDKDISELISDGPEGVKLISGGSGLKELALINKDNIKIIFKELNKLLDIFDYIIIDTGAGISDSVLDFVLSTDQIIVVSTPDPTSIMDAYILIKSLSIKKYSGDIKLITNMVKNSKEAYETYNRINNVAYEFLDVNIDYLGYINKDDLVVKSVREQVPFTILYPNKKVSSQVDNIANNLIKDLHNINKKENFATRLLKFFTS